MQHLLSTQLDKLGQAGRILLSPSAILSLPQLLCAFSLAILFLAWRQKQRRGRVRLGVIWRALRGSARLLRHRSTGADFIYYLVNTFAISGLIGWGLFSAGSISAHMVQWLTTSFGSRPASALPSWLLRGSLTLLAFMAYELAYYADHYAKHKIPFLWAFHQTHHSAEILTPLTVFRVHPLDTLIFINIVALVTGTMHGLFLWGAGKTINLYLIASANALTVLFLFAISQLQHSQFWIPLRGLAGKLILSPAHHQLHHSIAPEHYNCNLGSCLAIWDWAFGTLDIPPKTSPNLTFGVIQQAANPHQISTLLLAPLMNALAAIKPRWLGKRPGAPPVMRSTPPV